MGRVKPVLASAKLVILNKKYDLVVSICLKVALSWSSVMKMNFLAQIAIQIQAIRQLEIVVSDLSWGILPPKKRQELTDCSKTKR